MGVVCTGVCAESRTGGDGRRSAGRSQTPGPSPAAAASPAPSAVGSSVGEQTTARAAAAPEVPAWIEAENATERCSSTRRIRLDPARRSPGR